MKKFFEFAAAKETRIVECKYFSAWEKNQFTQTGSCICDQKGRKYQEGQVLWPKYYQIEKKQIEDLNISLEIAKEKGCIFTEAAFAAAIKEARIHEGVPLSDSQIKDRQRSDRNRNNPWAQAH